MASLTRPARPVAIPTEGRRAVRDSLIVAIGGQLERALGTFTSLALRWGLDPSRLGVYTGLRLFLDNTNRSSLGVGLGAVQEIPVLLASGNEAEARRVANIAHTTNTLTCLLYSMGLIGWAIWRAPSRAGDPLANEWTWGLVGVAGLAILKRYESFLISVLRAYGEFFLTTRLDVFEACVSAFAVSIGLFFAGFWGLLMAVGIIISAKILYLHARHPLRFGWAWDVRKTWSLMLVGLPILANVAAFGAVLNLDRMLILSLVPDGERAAGLYTIALLGTGWSLDLAGRIVTVLSTYFLQTLGRTGDAREVARQAVRAAEAQAPALALGGAIAYVFAPSFLSFLMPRYAEGAATIRPLMPGMVLLGLSWPARQAMISMGRPYRLCVATVAGMVLVAEVGAIGAVRSGIVGVAWGMSIGYAGVALLTSASAVIPELGWKAWGAHLTRLLLLCGWFGVASWFASGISMGGPGWRDQIARGLALAALVTPSIGIAWRMYPEEATLIFGRLARRRK